MNKVKMSILFASIFISSQIRAEDGPYLSLGAGIGKIVKAKSNQDFPLILKSPAVFATPIESMTLNFKRAMQFDGAIGYQYGNYRMELSSTFLKAKYKKFEQNPPFFMTQSFGGSLKAVHGFINGYYDVPINNTIVPFLGAGIGYARIKNQFEHSDLIDVLPSGTVVNLPPLKFSMKDNSLAYQLIPGFKVNMTTNLAMAVDYRFSTTTKKMKALNSRLKSHTINAGLMYKF